jgi:uncharacterized membrane protein AbrB (regulator of aidB expression)
MIADSRLTDGQRDYLRGLPLYPWAVWSRRTSVGGFAFMFVFAVAGRGGATVAVPGFLLLFPLILIDVVVSRLVFSQMRQVLEVQRFMEQARLGVAIRRVIDREAFLSSRTWN